jgi:hypothetical protein
VGSSLYVPTNRPALDDRFDAFNLSAGRQLAKKESIEGVSCVLQPGRSNFVRPG